MFSFFKSSKKSPIVSPTAEHRTNDNIQKNADDFVLINNNPSNIYPAVPPPVQPTASPSHHPFNRQFSVYTNYTNSVPFKLNPCLLSGNSDDEMWNFKLREMNSTLQRVVRLTDYDFKLERSIVES